ncbi:hypothetical protein [Novosphingobium sp. Gsoil 351]|uniref:hypothetical protein n=1 Tax=Novosphingobium sp. Gsoil 351 TaxID=2675225 RepID=UPI0012B45C71|nr:hypothetical protein [Novosphingobium sp. Gsoil 351]QGN55548.1 hypothetical protein GKE62_14310 [Novosphingobium sp. Gsoil 351]
MTTPPDAPSLFNRIQASLNAPVDPAVRDFAAQLGAAAGALAVLFYGSNLRTGSLDGVLDFYVLLPGAVEKGLWPRVSYHEREDGGRTLRAKVATMTLATFAAAVAGETLDTTIWARFVQPSGLVWVRDQVQAGAVHDAVARAAITAARYAVALGPAAGTVEDYWRALFRATYRAEFRIEKPGRENDILGVNAAHFAGLLPAALDAGGIAWSRTGDTLHPRLGPAQANALRRAWARRARLGKPYNLVRLLRASTTFDGAAKYAAWKIERHTGVPVTLTPWRERHPVLAAPGVLWRVWRARRIAGRA